MFISGNKGIALAAAELSGPIPATMPLFIEHGATMF
jgi:hypothetical protein